MAVVLVAITVNGLFIHDIGFTILGWSGDTVPSIGKYQIGKTWPLKMLLHLKIILFCFSQVLQG
jgi:hypothetical protein